jgi:hypothetical protein
MGLGVGIVLIALGAILAFAVSPSHISGGHGTLAGAVDIGAVGWILMIVGVLGLLLSLTVWSSWAGPGAFIRRRSTTYVDGAGGRVHRRETIDQV